MFVMIENFRRSLLSIIIFLFLNKNRRKKVNLILEIINISSRKKKIKLKKYASSYIKYLSYENSLTVYVSELLLIEYGTFGPEIKTSQSYRFENVIITLITLKIELISKFLICFVIFNDISIITATKFFCFVCVCGRGRVEVKLWDIASFRTIKHTSF